MQSGKVEICGVNTSSLKVLSAEEKKKLLSRVKNGDMQAREELIKGNLKLVLSVVKRFSSRGENPDDLFQVGCIGLIKAIDNFDDSHNVQFSTYAVPTNMLCRKEVKMAPRRWTKDTINKVFDDFILENDRLPTRQEMYGKYSKYRGCFPRSATIKLVFGLNTGEYFKKQYADYCERRKARVYGVKTNEYWLNNFVEQYIQLGRPTEAEYNRLKDVNTPNSQTLMKMIDTDKWTELLDFCKLTGVKVELKGNLGFSENIETYTVLYEKIKKIINDFK